MDDIVVVRGNIGQRLNNVDLYLLLYLIPEDFYSAWEATHGLSGGCKTVLVPAFNICSDKILSSRRL